MTYNSVAFALNNVVNHTEFTNLFDQYKICMVKINISYNHNSAEVPKSSAAPPPGDNSIYQSIPILHYAVDHDDNNALTSLDQLLQFGNYRKASLIRPVKIVLKPCVAAMTYRGVASTGYGAKRMWIDAGNDDVPHYGLKFIVDGGFGRVMDGATDVTIGRICIQTTYYIACKDVR